MNEQNNIRYGPLPAFPQQKRYTRIIIVVCLAIITYYQLGTNNQTRIIASSSAILANKSSTITCSKEFAKEVSLYNGCQPKECGRALFDQLISNDEVQSLLNLVQKCLSLTDKDKSVGVASIVDLHSGALSSGSKFVNLYKIPNIREIITKKDFEIYKSVRKKIQRQIALRFQLDEASLHLAYPTFFSRLTHGAAKTIHDEYWHTHIDKETYESFHYTSLLYLNTFGKDFHGGRFVFIESDNSTSAIEPRAGRLSMFTSGSENPHYVEQVTKGFRFAITVAFTCDASKAIDDPNFKK